MKSVVTECESCNGTGLYCGFVEAKGEAVICTRCHGSGAVELRVKDFTGRKKRRGITKIRFGSGGILDNTEKAKWISYDEFERLVSGAKV